MRWLGVLLLSLTLAGCGPSEYEKAQAKATAAKLLIEEAESALARIENMPISERPPEVNEAKKLWEADIEQGKQELREATEALRALGR